MIQANEQIIRTVVQQVLSQLGNTAVGSANNVGSASNGQANGTDGDWGVFRSVDAAVAAANKAFEQLKAAPMTDRAKAIECVVRICSEQAEELGTLEFQETKIGRLDHKIEKLTGIKNIPGIEFLKTEAVSGDNGLGITEFAPFGVIGAITPVTHSLPTLACNFVNMVASGNTIICNPHPGGKRIACEGVRRFNKAIHAVTGLSNLVTIIEEPTLETANEIFNHRDVSLLCVTGGPGVARAALASRKRAIVAGPGNPPVVVDETADIENAAASIVKGAAYDNNLLCIGEKEVFAVASIFDSLIDSIGRHGGYLLDAQQINALTQLAFSPPSEPGGHYRVNPEFIGKDPAFLAEKIGLSIPANTQILYGETGIDNPFVPEEQMMPFVPFIRCPDVAECILLAKRFEHGFGHTAIIHSRNVHTMTTMGRLMETTLFVQNGPCMASLGGGGEGYPSFSIATPTGEGVTNPLTFTRKRRSVIVNDLRYI